MKKHFKRGALSLVLAILMLVSVCACKTEPQEGSGFDNENDPLVFSTLEVDKVFNPFFSTSATDSNVVGMTQISMLGNDKDGKPTYGDNESVVVKDLQIVDNGGTVDVDLQTTYYFVLKNHVKFSNGSPLTIKDVLFNLYVYLDPAYTGSSTIYSTDIVGLDAYRTQTADENEQDNFMLQFQLAAATRIGALVSAADEIFDENDSLNAETFLVELQKYSEKSERYANVVDDYKKALELFRNELENDFTNSMDSYEDITFSDKEGTVYKNLLKTDVEAFLYNEGYISWDKKAAELNCACGKLEEVRKWTRDQAIDWVYNAKIPDSISEVVSYWVTATELSTYLTNQAMESYFDGKELQYESISGIKFANHKAPVTVNGVEYAVPTYNEDGSPKEGSYEVLSITINNVDPKAIWNFAFAVAPMYYYSSEEQIAKFDYESHFGVEYASQTFMTEVVKNPDKIGVPVGAGPYAASKSSGGFDNVKSGDFYNLGVIYFERNPYYVMGPAAIKKVRFQVVASAQMLNSLYNSEIDWAEPNAKPTTISELDGKKSDGIGNKSVQTSGYGYIGINAGKVPDIKVRQAIMHSINTQECVDYYQTTASAIHRSMSLSSWAYPDGATAYYPYIGGEIPENLDVVNPDYAAFVEEKGKKAGEKFTEAEQMEFLTGLVEESGFTLNGEGIYQKGNHILKYTFTIAGEETDHPAWQALYHSGEILNKIGFQINVTTDANALKKLSTGDLTVWAAAWGSTIDPDMYQVYHHDSTATSTWNWGYRQIKANVGGKYDYELALVQELSELIDEGRSTNDEVKRARIYEEALTIVMELAIELPTYQRDDLFAYNTNKIDVSTLTPDSELSPYKGLTSEIHKVSLNVEK